MPSVFSKIIPRDAEEREAEKRRLEHQLPPIPIIEKELSEPRKGEFLKCWVYSDPSDYQSEKNYINVRIFKVGTPESWLKIIEDIDTLNKGQALNYTSQRFTLARTILKGDARRAFEQEAKKAQGDDHNEDNFTDVDFDECIKAVTKHVFPRNALAIQKRWMRRWMCKPRSLTVRQYVARVMEIVSKFKYFPGYKAEMAMTNDEIADVIANSVPSFWERMMVLQGFDILDKSIDELTDFLERVEATEAMESDLRTSKRPMADRPQKTGAGKQGGAKQLQGPGRTAPFKNKRKEKWCVYHNTDKHDLSECKVMLDQAKKMRSNWNNTPRPPTDIRGRNKYFKPRPTSQTQDLNEMVDTAVARALDMASHRSRAKVKREEKEKELDELEFDLLNIHRDSSSDSKNSSE